MSDRLACRLCRRDLLDEAGCAACLPIKPNLIPIDAADEDAVPLAQIAAETAALLRAQLKQLKAAQKTSNGYNSELADQCRSQANALSKLLDSARKLQDDGAAAVETMSLGEKLTLFLDWYLSLPPAYRRKVLERMSMATPGQPTAGIAVEVFDDSAN